MWAIIITTITFVGAVVLSLAKTSARSEQITEKHRQELLNRTKKETEAEKKSEE